MQGIEIEPVSILGEQVDAALRSLIALTPNLLAALLILVLTWLIARIVRAALSRAFDRLRLRPALKDALVALTGTALWLAGFLFAATVALPGLTPAKLIAGLGIGSLAVGLAFKDIFENYLAGLLILLRKPMRIGDFVECQDIVGQVESIKFRDSYLRRTDGVLVMLPNAFIYKNPVRVLTDQDRRRQMLDVGVAYGESVGEARAVIEKAMQGLETVDGERPVQVFAKGFGSSSIDFEVAWWTDSKPVDIRRSRDEVVEAIKSALDEAGIEIPFPYRTLTFKEPLPVVRAEAAD
ncbi:MAG: mechanosensitive ion channel family protein [Alphaproteobacteria bacterium]